MSRCLYPGCAHSRQTTVPFCGNHWFLAPRDAQENLVFAINQTNEYDYRRVTDSEKRAYQRAATIEVVNAMMRQAGSMRTNPYKSIR